MTVTVPGELRFARPRWLVVLTLLRALLILGAMLGYGLLLGGAGASLVIYIALLVLTFGPPIVIATASLPVRLTGPAPGLTSDGVLVQLRPWQRRLVTVPWSEVTMLWFGYVGPYRYLRVAADPRGAHADEWDPRHRRFGRNSRPLLVFAPGTVSELEIRAAVEALSGGAVTVADRGPEEARASGEEWPAGSGPGPHRRGPRFRHRPRSLWRTAPVCVLIGLLGVPFALDVAPPWYQPWWPGVAAVSTLPDACAVFSGDRAAALDLGGRRRTVDEPAHDECEYDVPKGRLTVILERRYGYRKSGPVAASERLDEVVDMMVDTPDRVPGLGDGAVMVANPPGTRTLSDRGVVHLVARRANVVLVVLYNGEKEPAIAQDAVLGAARATLDGLEVR